MPLKLAPTDELVRLRTADLETLERAQQAGLDAVTHEEVKPELGEFEHGRRFREPPAIRERPPIR